MALRRASDETEMIDLGDGDWVKVRSDVSKKVFRRVVKHMPNRDISVGGLSPDEGMEFQAALFEALVTEWSLPTPPTVEEYEALKREDVEVLDTKLAEHFSRFTPTPVELGKPETSQS
jgi:hypothetical protein